MTPPEIAARPCPTPPPPEPWPHPPTCHRGPTPSHSPPRLPAPPRDHVRPGRGGVDRDRSTLCTPSYPPQAPDVPPVPCRVTTGPQGASMCPHAHAHGRTRPHMSQARMYASMHTPPPVRIRTYTREAGGRGGTSQPYPRERPWRDVVSSEDVVYLLGREVSQNQRKRGLRGCYSPGGTGGRGEEVTDRPPRSLWPRTPPGPSGTCRSRPGLPDDAPVGVGHMVVSAQTT